MCLIYQVTPTSAHQYLEALKNHITVNTDISTAVLNLRDKIYRNEYINVVNNMDWLPCIGELSNNFCFDYVLSLIMNHNCIVNEDSGRGNVYFDRGKASSQCQKRQKYFLGLYIPYYHRVDHQLTEEEIILCYQ